MIKNKPILRINADSTALVAWANENGLSLNPKKTVAMIVGSAANLKNVQFESLLQIIVAGEIIPLTKSVKNLGLQISESLKWDNQVAYILGATSKTLYYLNARYRHLPVFIKKHLVTQLIFPRDYVSVTFIDLNKLQSAKLEKQLNKSIRFIFSLSRRQDTEKFRKKLRWFTLATRRKFLGTTSYPYVKRSVL